jgi:hypothetical protein
VVPAWRLFPSSASQDPGEEHICRGAHKAVQWGSVAGGGVSRGADAGQHARMGQQHRLHNCVAKHDVMRSGEHCAAIAGWRCSPAWQCSACNAEVMTYSVCSRRGAAPCSTWRCAVMNVRRCAALPCNASRSVRYALARSSPVVPSLSLETQYPRLLQLPSSYQPARRCRTYGNTTSTRQHRHAW